MSNIMEMLSLKGKSALVTGGLRGNGRGIAIALAQAGADIAIMDRKFEEFPDLDAEFDKTGVKYSYFAGDVTNVKECDNIVAEVVEKFGKLDILVNNAGICKNVEAENMSWDQWYDVINVNLNGVFLMSQAAGREMIKRKSGSIINISSMSASIVNYPQPQCAYNASKAAVNHLTKSLAYEWAKYNIRVNAIAPGYIETDITRPGLSKPMGKIWVDLTPMKRVGQPEELGGIAVYLASEAATFTTGSIIMVDGAYSVI